MRYGLRYTIDATCQPCLDGIWDKLEVVKYLERRHQLTVEALSKAFSEAYPTGTKLQALNVDLKSPYFSPSPRLDADIPRSVVITEGQMKDQIIIYRPPDSSQVLSFRYRLEAIMQDGSRFQGDWISREESLNLIVTNADVRALLTADEQE